MMTDVLGKADRIGKLQIKCRFRDRNNGKPPENVGASNYLCVMYALLEESTGEYKDKGSKFLAFARPVFSQEEAEGHVAELKKQYYDARHWCSAYRLGEEGELMYSNDDGEPSNSAGAPILAAIRSADLTDVSIVVVRYFGGVKLGVRGLIDAYRGAAEDALAVAKIEEIVLKEVFTLSFAYTETSEVNRILHRFPTEQVDAEYTDTCKLVLSIDRSLYQELEGLFQRARIAIEKQE
jgi:uncharacterized YigZ family protein